MYLEYAYSTVRDTTLMSKQDSAFSVLTSAAAVETDVYVTLGIEDLPLATIQYLVMDVSVVTLIAAMVRAFLALYQVLTVSIVQLMLASVSMRHYLQTLPVVIPVSSVP